MGIRFFCPNGHSLNVKSELAGKIGFCPVCNVRMLIPKESIRRHKEAFVPGKSRVAQACPLKDDAAKDLAVSESDGFGTSSNDGTLENLIHKVAVDSAEKTSKQSEDSNVDEHPVSWFVAPADRSQQYGPATEDVIRSWIQERRITPNMLVFCSKWNDWKRAEDVFPEIKEIFEPAVEQPKQDDGISMTSRDSNFQTGDLGRRDPSAYLNRRQKRAFWSLCIICGLIALSLVLLGVLIFLLVR